MTTCSSPPRPHPAVRLAHGLWQAVRLFAYGIDAASTLARGRDVPPGHGSRRQGSVPPR